MFTGVKSCRLVALGVLGLLIIAALPAPAQAQVVPPVPPPNPFFNPALSGVRTVPPWAFNNPFGGAINPYTPFAPGAGALGFNNPYLPGGGDSGAYNPYYPYSYDPASGFLRGTADYMRAYGRVLTSQEEARILREYANQARLETLKRRFDYEMYVKANTPTFSEEQAKVAKQVLKRIQSNASLSDIWSGRSLNILMDDLRKYPNKKVDFEAIALTEDVLKRINVARTNGNLGLLRNEGNFSWPLALQDLLTETERKEIQLQAKRLVNQAQNNSQVDSNVLKDFANQLKKTKGLLSKNVNDVPTGQFLEAKRFLNDLEDAYIALKNGDGMEYFNFYKFASSGKTITIQQVVDYIVANGLRFAPAVSGDEAAYQALHSALAAYDVALNTQITVASQKE
jgi:hypothetical protein